LKNKVSSLVLLLVFLSIFMINLIHLGDRLENVIDIQVRDENFARKLKSSFKEEWNITWDKGDIEYGTNIVVNELNGDFYVVGYNASTNYDIILIKYNNLGQEQWNITWDNGDEEFAYDIALDSQGYIYVGGANGTLPTNFDMILLKFNDVGNLIWKRTWDSGFNDGCWALEIDTEDMIYITGQTYSTVTASMAVLLLKYDSSGNLIWDSIYDEGGIQIGRDIAVDSNNNLYITGATNPSGVNKDLLIAKFDNLGNHIWNRSWGGGNPEEGWSLVMDSKNYIYATGPTESYGAVQKDFVLVKYDNNGIWQWNRTWGTIADDDPRGIDVDSADNIYIGGYGLFLNVSLIKYSSSGNLLWYRHWLTNPANDYFLNDLLIDSSDKIYIVGYYGTGGPYNIFAAKFSIESPGGFTLSSDSPPTNTNGAFTLSWTDSPRVSNYSIYNSLNYISEVNNSFTPLLEETTDTSLPLNGYSNGLYFFIAVAFNDFGNSTSNCISITVEVSAKTQPVVLGYNLLIFILIMGFISSVLIFKRLKLK
jgi:hypothetical protein